MTAATEFVVPRSMPIALAMDYLRAGERGVSGRRAVG